MADQIPPWGRANRRIERQAARELAKSLIREGRRPREFRWDISLTCLVAAMAVIIVIAPPQSRVTMSVWLVVMAGLGAYPAFHLSEWIPLGNKWVARAIGIAVLVAVITGFGYLEWPPIRRHILSAKERVEFENALRPQKGSDLRVQIGCPAGDEKACVYAEQFVNLFGESEWNIQPFVSRLTLSKAQEGVFVYRRGGDKQDMMKRWNSGGWFNINETHLLAIQNAFRALHIEIDGGANPDLAENIIMVYVGPERENEAEPTS
jgi:hypothetical protein